jgi:hypothetical protein
MVGVNGEELINGEVGEDEVDDWDRRPWNDDD